MFNSLLVRLIEERPLPNLWDIDHIPQNVIGVWWFHKPTGLLEYSSGGTIEHGNIKFFGDIKNKDSKEWIRGRVIKWEDKIYLVIYIASFVSSKEITRNQLELLLQKLKSKNVLPDKVIDDSGYSLIEETKIKE